MSGNGASLGIVRQAAAGSAPAGGDRPSTARCHLQGANPFSRPGARSKLSSCFRRIRRCESGVEAIEFAIVSPVVLLLILGTVELGFAFAAQHLMESGMYEASRLGRTGHIAADTTQEETITASLADRAGIMLHMENVVITSAAYDEFTEIGLPEPFTDANGNGTRDDGENYDDLNGNGQWDEDRGTVGYGESSQIVVYTATYPWPIHTPILRQALGTDGFLTLSAHAVVKNEPY